MGALGWNACVTGRDDVVTSRLAAAGAAFQTVNSTMILAMRPLRQAGTVNGFRTTAQQMEVSRRPASLSGA